MVSLLLPRPTIAAVAPQPATEEQVVPGQPGDDDVTAADQQEAVEQLPDLMNEAFSSGEFPSADDPIFSFLELLGEPQIVPSAAQSSKPEEEEEKEEEDGEREEDGKEEETRRRQHPIGESFDFLLPLYASTPIKVTEPDDDDNKNV
jgi:hypothetical protein